MHRELLKMRQLKQKVFYKWLRIANRTKKLHNRFLNSPEELGKLKSSCHSFHWKQTEGLWHTSVLSRLKELHEANTANVLAEILIIKVPRAYNKLGGANMPITMAPNIAHRNSVTLEPKDIVLQRQARLESVVFTDIGETKQHPELWSERHHYTETLFKESACYFSSIKGEGVPSLSLRD